MAIHWQIGDRIQNRWEIYKILGGGMGIVYVVYDHEWHEAFAAKTFQDEIFARDPRTAQRFTQEALVWVNLDVHQNVVQARFVEQIEGKPFLFLEYVSGGDLGGWIGTPRLTHDLPQVLRFAIHFCDGMIHALSKGIKAHRDIKPQNCLVTEDRTLKVTDFGLAKVFDDAPVGRAALPDSASTHVQGLAIGLTRTGAGAGTPHYMAPEQFDDAKHVDVRADIYSFGVMLFQMIAGRLPFTVQARTREEAWEKYRRAHQAESPPKLETRNPKLETVIQTCLAKDPAHRFADFDEVRERLAEIYKSLTGEPAPKPTMGSELGAVQWNNKGVSLDNLGRHEEAISCYERALGINPRLEEAWYNKGVALGALGRTEEALSCYERALEINPRYEAAWFSKGVALGALGRPEEAIACYERALEISPHLAEAWFNKGVTLFDHFQQYRGALACFEEAQRLGLPQAAQAIALCRQRLGK